MSPGVTIACTLVAHRAPVLAQGTALLGVPVCSPGQRAPVLRAPVQGQGWAHSGGSSEPLQPWQRGHSPSPRGKARVAACTGYFSCNLHGKRLALRTAPQITPVCGPERSCQCCALTAIGSLQSRRRGTGSPAHTLPRRDRVPDLCQTRGSWVTLQGQSTAFPSLYLT